jgi:hypothetical protein
MNQDYEKKLEQTIDRELKGLGEIPAPTALIARVMTRLQSQAALPWYRRAWTVWPLGLRLISLAVLMAMFGGICFASWKVTQAESFLALVHQANSWFTGANTLWSALNSVLNVGVLLIKKLGTTLIVAGLLAIAMGYAMCIGVGTFYVRLALGRR